MKLDLEPEQETEILVETLKESIDIIVSDIIGMPAFTDPNLDNTLREIQDFEDSAINFAVLLRTLSYFMPEKEFNAYQDELQNVFGIGWSITLTVQLGLLKGHSFNEF